MRRISETRMDIANQATSMLVDKVGLCIDRIWLFGSVARGEDHEGSDIDLMCLYKQGQFPTTLPGVPIDLVEKVKEIEKLFKERGHKIEIDIRDAIYFLRCVIDEEQIGDDSYRGKFFRDIYKEKIVLYDSSLEAAVT